MATGFIGRSFVSGSIDYQAGNSKSGTVLEYTCPAAGVRYAVLTIIASLTCTATQSGQLVNASAGDIYLTAHGDIAGTAATSNTLNYTIILAPGQQWTGTTKVTDIHAWANTASNNGTTASLTASVLEVL